MRRNRIITIVIVTTCLLAVLAGGLVLRRHYLPTSGPTNALFEKYKDNSHIDVCLLRDFHVNDTLAVETILLQATTDSAWCALLRDFGMSEEFIAWYQSNQTNLVNDIHNSILLFSMDKNNPQKRLSENDPDGRLVIGSYAKRTLCIFMTEGKIRETIILSETNKL